MKAYTELEIKIDFFKVVEEALVRTSDWKKDIVKKGGRFEWTECTSSTSMGYYDLMRKALFKQYTDNEKNYDKRFYINSVTFKKELDDYVDKLSMGEYLIDLHKDASTTYKSVQSFLEKCFDI